MHQKQKKHPLHFIVDSFHFRAESNSLWKDEELQRQQKCKRQATTRSISTYTYCTQYYAISFRSELHFSSRDFVSSFSCSRSPPQSRPSCCINFLCYRLSCCCKALFDFCACSPICFDGNSFFLLPHFISLVDVSFDSLKHATNWYGKRHRANVGTVIKIYMPIWRRRCALIRSRDSQWVRAVCTCFIFHTPYILNCTNSISFPFILFSSIVLAVGCIFYG